MSDSAKFRWAKFRWAKFRWAKFGMVRTTRSRVAARREPSDSRRRRRSSPAAGEGAAALFAAFVDPYALLAPVTGADGSVADFVLVDVNARAAEVLGRARSRLVGQRLGSLGDGEQLAALLRSYAEVMHTGTPLVRDAEQFTHADGGSRYLAIRAVPTGPQLSVTWRDVTSQVAAMQRAHESEVQLRTVLDTMFDPLFVLVPIRDRCAAVVDFEIVNANSAACRAVGVDDGSLTGRRMTSLFPPDSASGPAQVELFASALQHGEPLVLDEHCVAVWAEDHRFYDLRVVPVEGVLNVTVRDVTERQEAARKLAESEERYRLITHNSSDVIVHIRGREIVWVSPSVVTAFGVDRDDWVGQLVDEIVDGSDIQILDEVRVRIRSGETVVRRLRVRAPGRLTHWVEVHAGPYLDGADEPDGVIAGVRIVDAEVHALRELDRLARVDELTGLLNRREGLARIEHLHHPSRRMGARHALLFCDVDSFKVINDTFGHAVGDQVLRTLSHRILAAIRAEDLVARMGGDEFMVLLSGVDDMSAALDVAEKIRVVARVPIATSLGPVAATLSIGATMAAPGESGDALLARADRAMYEAKARGRDQVVQMLAGPPR